MTYTVYSSPLLACVQKLVRERPATIRIKDLAAEMGVSSKWLGDFANGKFGGANAVIIERLYVRLTGKQLVDHV